MSERTKKILTIVAGVVLVGLMVWGLAALASSKGNEGNYNPRDTQWANDDNGQIDEHYRGNLDSGVILVEYGDFQCSGCATADERIQSLVGEFGDKIGLIFRNYPMPTMHPNAKAAAAAVEAAGLQGKYWEMHALVYEKQGEWFYSTTTKRTEQFQSYARELELDMTEWNKDFASTRVVDKVNFDLKLGEKDNVNATPFFVLNGRILPANEWGNDEKLRQVLNEEIAKSGNNTSASEDADTDDAAAKDGVSADDASKNGTD